MASRIGYNKFVAVSYAAIFRKDTITADGLPGVTEVTYLNGVIYLKPHPEAFTKELHEWLTEICDDHPDMILISFSHTKLN